MVQRTSGSRGLAPLWPAASLLLALAQAHATTAPDLFSLSPAQLAGIDVVTASRAPQPLSTLAASVTVIDRQRIQELGAATIYDVLRLVPGLRVEQGARGRPVLSVRGVRRESGSHVLFLLDGHSLNDTHDGSATFLFELSKLPLQNIERIEVMRGPGSAVYGENAFMAVVNVITRAPEDIAGTELSLRSGWDGGHHLGQELNLLSGQRLDNGLGLSFNFNLMRGNGPRPYLSRDLLGRSGTLNTGFDQVDLQARADWGGTRVQARYTRQKRGEGYGAQYIVSPGDRVWVDGGYLEVSRSVETVTTEVRLRAYLDRYAGTARVYDWPPGSIPSNSPLAAFNATGQYDELSLATSKFGLELQATDTRFSGHRITYGALLEYQAQDDLKTLSNDIGTGVPVSPARDVSALRSFGQDARRTLLAPFVEDIWRLDPDLTGTLGLRLDHYSDFGQSLNPRLGLRWQPYDALGLRLLWGTAFRAPDFRVLHLTSPVLTGNPDLRQERVNTLELGLDGRLGARLSVGLSLFRNRLRDLIVLPPGSAVFQNAQGLETRGLELVLGYALPEGGALEGSYTLVDAAADNGGVLPDVPRHSGTLVWRMATPARVRAAWSLYWQSDSPRAVGDPRPSLPGYAVLDLGLGYRLRRGLELELTVDNLLDRHYVWPSPAGTLAADFQAPGRSLLLGLKAMF